VHVEARELEPPALRNGDLQARLDLRQIPQHPGRAMRSDAIAGEASRHEGLVPGLRRAHPAIDAGMDPFPIVALDDRSPLAGREARLHRLPPGNKTML